MQTFILTHKKDFLQALSKDLSENNCFYFNIIKNLNWSKILKIDCIKSFLKSEFRKTIDRLENYLIDINSSSIWNIQNDIRKIFEDILILKYYRILRNESRTLFTYNTLNENFFNKWLLNNIKDDLVEISKFVNEWSHFTEVSWNEPELCWYINKTFDLILKI
jgi:hypothetical protein